MQLSIALGVMATVAQALTAPLMRQPPTPAPESAVPRNTRPVVVCGTVVVPVDAAVDPGMARSVPTDRAFTIRTIKPPLCRD